MEATMGGGKILINFGWKGPNTLENGLHVSSVGLNFKKANSDFSVTLPTGINPDGIERYNFTVIKYLEPRSAENPDASRTPSEKTEPSTLSVTVDKIRSLKVGYTLSLGEVNAKSSKAAIVSMPDAIEVGQTYTLVASTDGSVFSVVLQKEGELKRAEELDSLTVEELKSRFDEACLRGISLTQNAALANLVEPSAESTKALDLDRENVLLIEALKAALERKSNVDNQGQDLPSVSAHESARINQMSKEDLEAHFSKTIQLDMQYVADKSEAKRVGNSAEVARIEVLEIANRVIIEEVIAVQKEKGYRPQGPIRPPALDYCSIQ